MLVTHRFSNGTLILLQRHVNAQSASMSRMRCSATTDLMPVPPAPADMVAQLQAELLALRAELASVRAERDQLCGLLADLHASQVQLRAQLADTQAQLAAVEAEREQTRQELVDLKRKPFSTRSRSDDTAPPKPRGRPSGHVGSGRVRPTRSDQIQTISAGDACPDCGTAFTGIGTTRSRVVEDIVLVRPTVITKYVIERRWCPSCRSYHEDAVTQALPRHRLGLHVLLFVV
jgi:zinc-finger binding domain of transposase IS66